MSMTGRFTAFSATLFCLVAYLAIAALAPATASAEREDDEPMFHRLGKGYLDTISPNRQPHFETNVHAGAFFGYTNRLFWREFDISDSDLNFHGGGFVQFEGVRLEGYGYWSDNLDPLDFEHPSYWEVNLNYLLRIDQNMVVFGVRRNGLADAPDPNIFPAHVDEAYIKLIAVPSELQGEGSVNLTYTVAIHQRIDGDDGTLVDLGFQTLSTNAWVIGDVLGLSGKITFNHKFLQPYGRFTSYMFTAKTLKDISNIDDPGRGPLWLELSINWHGAISSKRKNEATFYISLWAVF